ncbi:MAG: bifunctional metallophosphatase/5'-nucleotidase [Bacteroidales bacterium]|nr:bifunctional metallophosphatase/5'-nucleotidase [Bacteroidales bacterium]
MMNRLKFLKFSYVVFIILLVSVSCRNSSFQEITIFETTDLHGAILPFDFIEMQEADVSLAQISECVNRTRKEKREVILLDNGDNLQGQPPVYYYNFLDTNSLHINALAMNYMKFDASTVGNHDIEAGHSVYDRLTREYDFPLLAANAVNIKTGKPYFNPYVLISRKGIKIAVLGMITPAVPNWLPPKLYSGIEFRDMLETARKWMPEIMKEKPDIVIGLFHSGWDPDVLTGRRNSGVTENGAAEVAFNVPGFDIIFTGHDHNQTNEWFTNIDGKRVLILNAGSRAEKLARADIRFIKNKVTGKIEKEMTGSIIDVSRCEPDPVFLDKLNHYQKAVQNYVSKILTYSEVDFSTRDSYFGSSAFVDMIHSVQLAITGAQVSFSAPLSFDVMIKKGPLKVGDMFKLYRFENMLYTVKMTGEEIDKYLEYSYAGWINTMQGPEDYLLKYRLDGNGKPFLENGKAWLRNQPYNFDSAAGINYIVDASKPDGMKVNIISMSDGTVFDRGKSYLVALNSYRGSGGGGHLSEGAGISPAEFRKRIVSSTDKDLRFYVMKSLEKENRIHPIALNNWRIIPEEWVRKAIPREKLLLFGSTN